MSNALPPSSDADPESKTSKAVPRRCEKWVLVATILGSSMAFLDGTVANLILAALQNQMHATVEQIQWVIESYALFSAALLIVGGALGDLYGRRFIFLLGTTIFTLASIGCGLAANMPQLILARAIQGIGAALLIPGSLAIITACFPDERRGTAIGIWSGYTAIATAMGPVIGGWLVQNVSWRLVFFINVPLAIIVFISTIRHVPESKNDSAQKLDVLGATLIVASLGAIVFGLIERDYSRLTLSLIELFGILCFIAFIVVELRAANPMVPFVMFKSRDFAGANLITLFLYAALFGILFFLPLDLIQIQNYSATEAGAALLPFVLLMFLLSKWAGGLVYRYGARLPLTVGPTLIAISLALLTSVGIADNYWRSFFPTIFILGLGMATSVAPLTTVVMSSIERKFIGAASGVNNAISRIAGLLSIAIFGVVMTTTFNHQLITRLEHSTLPEATKINVISQKKLLAGIKSDNQVAISIVHKSFLSSYRLVLWLAVLQCLAASICAFIFISSKFNKRQ